MTKANQKDYVRAYEDVKSAMKETAKQNEVGGYVVHILAVSREDIDKKRNVMQGIDFSFAKMQDARR